MRWALQLDFRSALGRQTLARLVRIGSVCNLYSITKGPQAIRDFTRAMCGDVGNMPPLPGVFPDYFAPIVRNGAEGRELVMARWGHAVAVRSP
jgi:hypothetical protein